MFDFTSLGFKKIKDLKPGSVFLVEDQKCERFVIKKSPATPRVVRFSQLVHQKGSELAEVMPVFWEKGEFLCQKFLTWELAGDTVETYGLRREAFSLVDPEKLGRAIFQLQNFPFTDQNLDTRLSNFYLKNTGEFKEALNQEFGPDFFTKVEHFLTLGRDLVDKYSCFLANGDLHPQNIMIQKLEGIPPPPTSPKFLLVDWDLLHINNPGWDLTDLYVWGWRDSSWQNRLLNSYKKSLLLPISDFEQIFAFDVVYLSSQLIKHAKIIKTPQEFLEVQKRLLRTFLS